MDDRFVAVYDSELSTIMNSDRWIIKDSVTDGYRYNYCCIRFRNRCKPVRFKRSRRICCS